MSHDPRPNPVPEASPLASIERRAHQRHSSRAQVLTAELDQHGTPGVPVAQELQDLSRSGAGLRGRRPMGVGRVVVIVFKIPGQAPRLLRAIVRDCRYDGQATYVVGVELLAAVSPEPLADWAARL